MTDLSCLECKSGFFVEYNTEKKIQECKPCKEGLINYGGNFVVNKWNEEEIKSYGINLNCHPNDMNQTNSCNPWELKNFSIYSSQSIPSKNTITFNVHSAKNGKVKFDYQKSKNAYLNVYLNKKMQIIKQYSEEEWNEFYLNVQSGDNEYIIEHLTKEPNVESYIHISYIIVENSEYSAFNCDKNAKIEDLSLSNCEYDSKCNKEKDICDDRFYTHIIEDTCDKQLNNQNMNFKLIKGAECKELMNPLPLILPCKKCQDGQFLRNVNEVYSQCEYCPEGTYLNYKTNKADSFSCWICPSGVIKKVYYFKPEIPNKATFSFSIIEHFGTVQIISEKFDYKRDNDYYLQISRYNVNNYIVEKYTNKKQVKIELPRGQYQIEIKGRNLHMTNIIITNSDKGGGYTCQKGPDEYVRQNCNKEKKHFSLGKQCIDCPSFTHVEYNNSYEIPVSYCSIDNKNFVNNEYKRKILFDNFLNSINKEEGFRYSFNDGEIMLSLRNRPVIYDTVTNIVYGKEISDVNMVDTSNQTGLLISFQSNDECGQGNQYRSYVFFQCDKLALTPEVKLINSDDSLCDLFFVIKTINACPICTSSEVLYYDTKCDGGKFTRIYEENDTCLLLTNSPSQGKASFDKPHGIILGINNGTSEVYSEIFTKFSLNKDLKKIDIDYSKVTYIESEVNIFKCENKHPFSLLLLTLGAVVFILLIIICGICVYIYSKKPIISSYENVPQTNHIELPEVFSNNNVMF